MILCICVSAGLVNPSKQWIYFTLKIKCIGISTQLSVTYLGPDGLPVSNMYPVHMSKCPWAVVTEPHIAHNVASVCGCVCKNTIWRSAV